MIKVKTKDDSKAGVKNVEVTPEIEDKSNEAEKPVECVATLEAAALEAAVEVAPSEQMAADTLQAVGHVPLSGSGKGKVVKK